MLAHVCWILRGRNAKTMDKFSLVDDPAAMPSRFFGLPDLHYPDKLNVVRTLFSAAAQGRWLDRPALYFEGHATTYASLIRATAALAAILRESGVFPGDRVLLRYPDTPDLVTAFLAVQAIGAVVVPTFAQLRDEDLIYRVEDTDARVALVATELAPSFVPVADACQTLRNVLIAPNDPTGRFTSLGSHKITDDAVPDYADTRADDLVVKAMIGLMERNGGVPADRIDDVAIAATTQQGDQGLTLGRTAAILAGLPITVPGYALDRMCAGAMTTVTTVAGAIAFGAYDLAIAGGVEHMGRHPMGLDADPNPRFLSEKLVSPDALNMGITAERLHDRFPSLTKERSDSYGMRSQQKVAAAYEGVALVRRQSVPAHRFGVVLRRAASGFCPASCVTAPLIVRLPGAP